MPFLIKNFEVTKWLCADFLSDQCYKLQSCRIPSHHTSVEMYQNRPMVQVTSRGPLEFQVLRPKDTYISFIRMASLIGILNVHY